MAHFWLGILAEDIEPYCDGDFTEEDHIEDDGFITVYCSGAIRAIEGQPKWTASLTPKLCPRAF
jgi:hypothetical protein